jgi:UDP-N-acetyl-D-glucosamine dehydrogenase
LCVVGLGYVGLPLATAFAEAGLRVTGIDLDRVKCGAINAGRSLVQDVTSDTVARLVSAGLLQATTNYGVVESADVVTICVPTPLGKSRDPDISYIVSAVEAVTRHMHAGMLLILESTTYPGTTEEILLPRIAARGYHVGEDVFVAYSPERVDPGNQRYRIHNTPKVVGGVTPRCLSLAQTFYGLVVERVVPVSSTATAEMCKILENTYRAVNIGLVNEMALICQRLGIDIWEVIAAAATKPFGFTPFYPGPGLGGHCIPIDPLYLTWKMRGVGMQTRFIELADVINSEMPHYVVRRVQDALNDQGTPLRGARLLILGVAYKRDVADVRESPASIIARELLLRGAQLAYHDPYVPEFVLEGGEQLQSTQLTAEALQAADCVLVHTDHQIFDWDWIAQHAHLIFDTRNTPLASCDGGARVIKL